MLDLNSFQDKSPLTMHSNEIEALANNKDLKIKWLTFLHENPNRRHLYPLQRYYLEIYQPQQTAQ